MGSLATLEVFGADSGLTASKKTMSFVTNHDTDRNGPYLSYKDGARYKLANKWLLAEGYGSPQVYSSFTWGPPANPPANATDDDKAGKTQSPPSRRNGRVTNTDCSSGQWTCDHRDRGIVAMIGWHQDVGNAPKRNFYTDDFNVIAFSKGNRGWAAFNNGPTAKPITVQTGLPRNLLRRGERHPGEGLLRSSHRAHQRLRDGHRASVRSGGLRSDRSGVTSPV